MIGYADKIVQGARYSLRGLRAAWGNEQAFRIEVALLAVVIPAALLLARNFLEAMLLVAVYLPVLILELVNSAIEATVDRMGKEAHPLAGRAKDQASAAVMVTAFMVVLLWLCILLD